MSIEDFLKACKLKGWHFTFNWVTKRLKQLKAEPLRESEARFER